MSFKSFLSSKKERRAWHRGIYKGLRVYWNPWTLYKEELQRKEEFTLADFREWEDQEQHYEEPIMVACFLFKYVAIGYSANFLSQNPWILQAVAA